MHIVRTEYHLSRYDLLARLLSRFLYVSLSFENLHLRPNKLACEYAICKASNYMLIQMLYNSAVLGMTIGKFGVGMLASSPVLSRMRGKPFVIVSILKENLVLKYGNSNNTLV